MKVLHLSHTPLVGAPGRICAALQQRGVNARWAALNADGYGGLNFALDWRWQTDRDEVLAFAQQADLIHLHNYIDLQCADFAPLDFAALWRQGKPMVRHFHSTSALVARYMGIDEAAVLACPIPKLVIAQYPERFFARACVVPNIVDEAAPPTDRRGQPLRVGYAPSSFRSARASRWDTKGYPETVKQLSRSMALLRRQGLKLELDLITQVPHSECLVRKARCDVFIDELVTGSYHLNTLESLAQGCASLVHLDGRLQGVLRGLLGSADFPALSVPLEGLHAVLAHFAAQPELARALGARSRLWMQQHWTPAAMAQHFIDAYEAVMRQPRLEFPARFGDSQAELFQVRTQYDLQWSARHAAWPPLPPAWWTATRQSVGQGLRAMGFRR